MSPISSFLFDTERTREAFNEALHYLQEDCGLFVPDFRLSIRAQAGGSFVSESARGLSMTLGCYPTRPWSDWFVMHELAHVLVAEHRPLRRRKFAATFGAPMPEDYDHQQWKTLLPRRLRPTGHPSLYARDGGVEEHFAELVAFMYTQPRAFASAAPSDLRRTWKVAWDEGLARMAD